MLCGGYTKNGISNHCYRIGPNTIEEMYSNDVSAYKSGFTVMKDKVFITGGLDESIDFVFTFYCIKLLTNFGL